MKNPKVSQTIIFLLFGLMLGLGASKVYGQFQPGETASKTAPGNPPSFFRYCCCCPMERLCREDWPEPDLRVGMGWIRRIISELELSSEQREKADRLLAKNQEESKKLIDSLRKTREELRAIASAPMFNESEFRKTFQRASSIKEDLMVLRLKTISEVSQMLTPEQRGYLRGRLAFRGEFFRRRGWLCPKEKGRLDAGKPE